MGKRLKETTIEKRHLDFWRLYHKHSGNPDSFKIYVPDEVLKVETISLMRPDRGKNGMRRQERRYIMEEKDGTKRKNC